MSLHTKRLTAYEAPKLRCRLVPVEIPEKRGDTPVFSVQAQWNRNVRRWHRRAGL